MLAWFNALRVYKTCTRSPKGTIRSSTLWYVFKCECGEEFRVRRDALSKRGDRCLKCFNLSRKGTSNIKNRKRPYESLYNKFLGQVSDRGLKTDVTFEDFMQFTNTKICHYCGSQVQWSEHYINKNGSGSNLDRKGNGDYLIEDLVVACDRCNKVKGIWFTYEEFLKVAVIIKEIDKLRL